MHDRSIRFSYNQKGIDWMAEFLKWQLIQEWLDKYKIKSGEISAIFLAGAPGAGKTEFIESISALKEWQRFVVLDTDIYRSLFEGYSGSNAHEFQQYASRVMDKLFSFCMNNGLRVIMDGTFAAKGSKIDENIAQCVRHKRLFSIVLIYQDATISYLYTKIREMKQIRHVPREEFIKKYFASIDNVFRIAQDCPLANIQIVIKKQDIDEPKIYDTIKGKNEFYSMLETELGEIGKIDRNGSIEYSEEELEEKLTVLDEFVDMLKNNPEIGKELYDKIDKLDLPWHH